MLAVDVCGYSELTEEQQRSGLPDNGHGKESAAYLIVTHNEKEIFVVSDAMEPEDASFDRDLAWVKYAIEKAYELGKKDGNLSWVKHALEKAYELGKKDGKGEELGK